MSAHTITMDNRARAQGNDWKRARRCIRFVRLSARSLILCGLRAAPYGLVLAIHKL